MKLAEDLWLGSIAAQRNLLHVINYSTAFYGATALQGLHLGLNAPSAFWSALARVGAEELDPPANLGDAPNGAKSLSVEPVAEAAPPKAEAAPTPEPALDAAQVLDPSINPQLLDGPRGGKPDDLAAISGIGAKLAETLNEFGIYHYDQIATLNAAGIDWLNQQQPGFKALVARFDLVDQAKTLSD